MADRIEILPNTRFGRLTLIQHLVGGKTLCRCDCGKITTSTSHSLRNGRAKSCGCHQGQHLAESLRRKNLEGQQHGRWTIISFTETRKGYGAFWRCRCECGVMRDVQISRVLRGLSRSCGCFSRDTAIATHTTHGLSKTLGYVRANTRKRETAKLQRIASWANHSVIQRIYEVCPDGYTVDHIIPLQGKLVSGLHVENNLQYLTASENCRKRNHFTPYAEVASQTV